MLADRAVEVENGADVDPVPDEGEVVVHDGGLLSVLPLQHEGFSHFLGINNATKHNILIFCYQTELVPQNRPQKVALLDSGPGEKDQPLLWIISSITIMEYDEKQKADDDHPEMITSPKVS